MKFDERKPSGNNWHHISNAYIELRKTQTVWKGKMFFGVFIWASSIPKKQIKLISWNQIVKLCIFLCGRCSIFNFVLCSITENLLKKSKKSIEQLNESEYLRNTSHSLFIKSTTAMRVWSALSVSHLKAFFVCVTLTPWAPLSPLIFRDPKTKVNLMKATNKFGKSMKNQRKL